MRWFSERMGLTPVRDKLQIDDLDAGTRRRLWNVMSTQYFYLLRGGTYRKLKPSSLRAFYRSIWDGYLKYTFDSLRTNTQGYAYGEFKNHVIEFRWNYVLDFIEAIIYFDEDQDRKKKFISGVNTILEEESTAYRIIDGLVTRIITQEEILEVEEALRTPFAPIRDHLHKALDHLSNREQPDYRNSIKESISAVECVCKIITGDRDATLGKALRRLERTGVEIHGALRSSFSSLYGWTSDESGIRHALIDEETADFDYAKYMVVTCSAFVNFLISKAGTAGIDLERNLREIQA